jgi:hypothetical protein
MTWRQLDTAYFDKILAMILATVTSLRHLLGWVVSAFSSRESLILENLALRQAIAGSARQTTSPSTDYLAQAVLDRLKIVLVGMDEASRLGYSSNRRALASGWLRVVLEMDFKSPTSGRTKTGE